MVRSSGFVIITELISAYQINIYSGKNYEIRILLPQKCCHIGLLNERYDSNYYS